MTWRVAGLARDRRGAAATEFTVAAPAMILVFFGLFELARMLWINYTLQDAANDVARYATVTRTTDQSTLTMQMNSRLQSTVAAGAAVSVTQAAENGINFARITGSMSYLPLGGLIGIGEVTLTGRASVPITGGS